MNRIIKTAVIAASAAIGMLAVGGTALADAPDGTYKVVPVANEHASAIGKQSSQIHQNGQFVSGRYASDQSGAVSDWQNQRADRSDQVQDALGH